ncbi:hypothetical protein OIU85_018231 [Salix viminalis]|uniref:Serine-threonine/tyrosine-protein kinase catalytic domain-containing protein n=1 Tax=Salix viminalis TaxID=40686 RepID=A0A9Q0ZIS4_SALVM|nr:hypothetical protein OIU85_018231 [Salix viminalis]
MSSLTQLQSLDLSHNLLYGRIKVLGSLTSLASLNISYNNFSGPIPVTPFFRTLSSNSYLQNPSLCDSTDGYSCSPKIDRRNGLKSAKTIALISVILASVTIIVIASWAIVMRNHRNVMEKSSGALATSSRAEDFSYPWTFIPFQKLNFTIVSILDAKLQGLPDQMVQEMLQTLGIAMFCVNSSPAERPTMKDVVALLMEVKSPPEEWGKTSQPLMKQSSNQS